MRVMRGLFGICFRPFEIGATSGSTGVRCSPSSAFLAEAAEILKLTEPKRDRILLDFLRKCWTWRIEALPEEREPIPKNAFKKSLSEAGQASTAC